jgi:hypothetical protein
MNVSPDIEKIVIDYLAAHPDVDAITVTTDLPNRPVFPAVTVQQIGSSFRNNTGWSDAAVLDVDVWAATRADASRLARVARAALFIIAGYVHPEGTVVDVADLNGPSWQPDDTGSPVVPRYVFTVEITAHP